MNIEVNKFGEYNNQDIFEYTLTNSNDLSLSVINYGGIITKIKMPNIQGSIEEITTNMTTLDEIIKSRPFHGAIIGPVAGRISKGSYFDGENKIELDKNEKGNTLHGGFAGLDTQIWDLTIEEKDFEISLILNATHLDGVGGFPGDIEVQVTYTLNEKNEIIINYRGRTNKRTLFNPTNHVYFNLSGDYTKSLYSHFIQVNSNHVILTNEDSTPTGTILSVADTPFDLREGNNLGNVILHVDEEIQNKGGLDHAFLLNPFSNKPAVILQHSGSKRQLEIETDSDSVVIYTHNHVQNSSTDFDRNLPIHTGIAFETQQLPDAVNKENFGTIWLEPDKEFNSTTIFHFSLFEEEDHIF